MTKVAPGVERAVVSLRTLLSHNDTHMITFHEQNAKITMSTSELKGRPGCNSELTTAVLARAGGGGS